MRGIIMEDDIRVSIVMVAYNHGEFIRDALDSILMQKVNFNYEIIIGEDCSLDNTRNIIFEYQQKYPNIIKPIIRDKNVGCTKNFHETLLKCHGEYMASLEGDDFWTDPYKLQKQIDFLTNNTEYIAVAHRNVIVNKEGKIISYPNLKVPMETSVGKKELLEYTTTLAHPSSMCYRNIFRNSKEDFSIIADSNAYGTHFMMLALLISRAPMYIMDSYMSAWRCVISDDATNYTSMANKNPFEALENYFVMIANFKRYFGDYYDFTKINSKHFATTLFVILKSGKRQRWKYYKKFSKYLDIKEKIMSVFYVFAKGMEFMNSKLKSIFTRKHNINC